MLLYIKSTAGSMCDAPWAHETLALRDLTASIGDVTVDPTKEPERIHPLLCCSITSSKYVNKYDTTVDTLQVHGSILICPPTTRVFPNTCLVSADVAASVICFVRVGNRQITLLDNGEDLICLAADDLSGRTGRVESF